MKKKALLTFLLFMTMRPVYALADDGATDAATDIADGQTESPKAPEKDEMRTVVRGQKRMAPISGTIITGQKLQEEGNTTIAQVLNEVPGLQVSEHAKAGSEIMIRGFDQRASLLMFDGIPISEVYAGGYDSNTLLLTGVSAIEIERGVTSLLYGPGAMGGIIHIHSDPWYGPAGGKVEVQLRDLTTGEAPGYVVKAIAGVSLRGFSASLAFQSQKLGYFPLPRSYKASERDAAFHETSCEGDDKCLREGSDSDKQLLQARLAYTHGRFRLSALANYSWVERGVPPFESSGYVRYWRFSEYNTGLIGLSASLKPKSGMGAGNFSFDANYFLMLHHDTIEDYQDNTYKELTRNPLAWFRSSGYQNWTTGLNFTPAVVLWKNNTLRTNYGFKIDHNTQEEWTVPTELKESYKKPLQKYETMLFHFALEDQQKLGPVSLLAGISAAGEKVLAEELQGESWDVTDRTIPALEWRFALQYDVVKPLQLVAGVGRKTRFPTLKELFSNFVGGNSKLKPERALMLDFGGNLFLGKVLPFKLTYKVRGFVSFVDDLIDKPGATYINVNKALLAGVENSFMINPVSWFQFDLGYTYLYALDKSTNLPLDYRVPHYLQAAARFMLFFGLNITLDLRFASRTEAYYLDTFTNSYVLEEMPPYALVGLNIRQTWKTFGGRGSFYIFGDMRNTFDTYYVIGGFSPQPGRQIFVGLGATF